MSVELLFAWDMKDEKLLNKNRGKDISGRGWREYMKSVRKHSVSLKSRCSMTDLLNYLEVIEGI